MSLLEDAAEGNAVRLCVNVELAKGSCVYNGTVLASAW